MQEENLNEQEEEPKRQIFRTGKDKHGRTINVLTDGKRVLISEEKMKALLEIKEINKEKSRQFGRPKRGKAWRRKQRKNGGMK